MKLKRVKGDKERQILAAMITDSIVLSRIASKWTSGGLFKSQWANLVAGWCLKFFDKYHRPPHKKITSLFSSWASRVDDEKMVELVEDFLESLDDEFGETDINSEFVLDIAGEYFNEVQVDRLREELEGDIDTNEVEKALTRVHNFGRVELGTGAAVDPFGDEAIVEAAFKAKQDPVLVYDGALKTFFGDHLERDGFIAFMAPEKRGKSFWILDMVMRAVVQQRRVAYFEVGDMSQPQVIRRMASYVMKRPLVATGPEDEPTKYPHSLMPPLHVGDEVEVQLVEKTFDRSVPWKVASKKLKEYKSRSKWELPVRLSNHPNSSLSVAGMRSILQEWAREGWVPDLIAVDYADILAPPPGFNGDSRDAINASWKQLRALSQELHCLIVTATQADAASYKQDTLDRSNFSEDKRKFAHVTGMIGINSIEKERNKQICRLNWLVLRDNAFSESRCVYVASCLGASRVAVESVWSPKEVDDENRSRRNRRK